ncbi:hypothetical protein LJY25_00310 [Hymenobacter sp. BT175]|uniref:hypothetical protein n=1 Tax=Hymenobacter translucens TaxID=2886507 RepID=UPI001D0F20EA|nr:hypothetical protein [Hymenobacter translucens]MCC2544871.1 hypothetical protein [Hymenobacter translucens]
MALITSVLVRGINNLSDARYCAGMGADGLIFTLDPNLPGAVTPATVKELAGWVAGVRLLGEFDALPLAEVEALAAECGVQELLLRRAPTRPVPGPVLLGLPLVPLLTGQLPDSLAAQFAPLLPEGLAAVVEVPARELTTAEQARLKAVGTHLPLWLSGITPDNVRPLLEAVCPAGIILDGGYEIKPGLRDFDTMEAIFEQLEEEY